MAWRLWPAFLLGLLAPPLGCTGLGVCSLPPLAHISPDSGHPARPWVALSATPLPGRIETHIVITVCVSSGFGGVILHHQMAPTHLPAAFSYNAARCRCEAAASQRLRLPFQYSPHLPYWQVSGGGHENAESVTTRWCSQGIHPDWMIHPGGVSLTLWFSIY